MFVEWRQASGWKKQFLFKYFYFSICPFIYIFVWMHFYVTLDRNTFLHQPILILVLYGVSGSTKGAWPGSGNALTSVLRLQKEQWILTKRPCSTRHVCLNRVLGSIAQSSGSRFGLSTACLFDILTAYSDVIPSRWVCCCQIVCNRLSFICPCIRISVKQLAGYRNGVVF